MRNPRFYIPMPVKLLSFISKEETDKVLWHIRNRKYTCNYRKRKHNIFEYCDVNLYEFTLPDREEKYFLVQRYFSRAFLNNEAAHFEYTLSKEEKLF